MCVHAYPTVHNEVRRALGSLLSSPPWDWQMEQALSGLPSKHFSPLSPLVSSTHSYEHLTSAEYPTVWMPKSIWKSVASAAVSHGSVVVTEPETEDLGKCTGDRVLGRLWRKGQ